jgi:hypothetical protein
MTSDEAVMDGWLLVSARLRRSLADVLWSVSGCFSSSPRPNSVLSRTGVVL